MKRAPTCAKLCSCQRPAHVPKVNRIISCRSEMTSGRGCLRGAPKNCMWSFCELLPPSTCHRMTCLIDDRPLSISLFVCFPAQCLALGCSSRYGTFPCSRPLKNWRPEESDPTPGTFFPLRSSLFISVSKTSTKQSEHIV